MYNTTLRTCALHRGDCSDGGELAKSVCVNHSTVLVRLINVREVRYHGLELGAIEVHPEVIDLCVCVYA